MPFICRYWSRELPTIAAIPVELVCLLLAINSKNSTIEEDNSYSIIMGVISMQMMRQYSGVGHSKPKPSSSSMQLSKKRRFAVYPPKQYPAADKHFLVEIEDVHPPNHINHLKDVHRVHHVILIVLYPYHLHCLHCLMLFIYQMI